jgi:hypothetical protein
MLVSIAVSSSDVTLLTVPPTFPRYSTVKSDPTSLVVIPLPPLMFIVPSEVIVEAAPKSSAILTLVTVPLLFV